MLKAILSTVASLVVAMPAASQCQGDVTQDGIVNETDLAALLSAWGTSVQGDFDNDGVVGGTDLTILLGAWGWCPQTPAWATLIEAAPDPAVVYDADLRAAIIATGWAWRVKDTATQIEMLLIPPGSFQMGCSPSQTYSCYANENPAHTVTLTEAFYMGRYEVTQPQWVARMGSNPSQFQGFGFVNNPVERVNWELAQNFLSTTRMRLPTEAEWEYACRAGSTTAFYGYPANDDWNVQGIAWYSGNSSANPRAVGGRLANKFGLHDMSGNVSEWVNDWYSSIYYELSPAQNPLGPTLGAYRVTRGGAYNDSPNLLRSSAREVRQSPVASVSDIGFRVAKDPRETPSVTSITPAGGVPTGGTAITIFGSFLEGTTAVTIGGVPATSVQVVDASTVTAVTPTGSVGSVDVVVTGSKDTVTAVGGFTYVVVQVPAWATLIEGLPDPAVVTDAAHRGAIIATTLPWRVRDTATGIEFVLIPPGTFNMGCIPTGSFTCGEWESLVHEVTLTNAFYLGRYEVTQAQWQATMGSNPSGYQNPSSDVPVAQVPNRPVEQVSWNTIQGFLSATGMRLPTEAEWEYAYKAGTSAAFHGWPAYPNGTNDNISGQLTDIACIGYYTRPVGGRAGNWFGLHDMSGNVFEWCSDWYESDYYASSPPTNPQGPSSSSFGMRVCRGGGFNHFFTHLRGFARAAKAPDYSGSSFGFRVARTP